MGAGKLVGDHLWATSPSLKHNRFPFGTVLQKFVKPQTNCLNNVFICQHLLSVDGSNFSRRRRSLSVNRFWTENGLVVLDPKLQETQVWKCSRHSASSTRGGTDQQNETVLQVTFLHWIEIYPFQPVYRRVPSKSANSQIPQLCFRQSNKMHLFFCCQWKTFFVLSLLELSKSLKLLALTCWVRNFSMVSLGRGFSNDWDMSTSKRNFKFSQEVLKGSRPKKTVFLRSCWRSWCCDFSAWP